MKPNPARPFVVVASLIAAAAVIGADTAPKKKNAKAEPAAPAKAKTEAEAPAKADPKADEVLATVDGDTIKRGDVDKAIGKIMAQRGMPPDALPPGQRDQITRSMLDDLILDKLVAKASAGVAITDAEVESEFQKIRQRRGGTDEDIKNDLQKLGMTIDSLKAEIRDRMQKMKWVSDQTKGKYQEASDAEAKEFYEKNPQHFEQPEQVRASHILIKLEPNANPEQITAAMKKAEGAIGRAKKEDFGKLAQELSDDPGSKTQGGDLSFFPRQGAMVEPFAEAAFKLKKDEVTAEPVRSQFGYHVIKQTDRKPASKQSFDEAKPQIVGFLGNERKNGAVQTVLTDLRGKAKVDVKLPPPPAPEAAPSVATPPVSAPEAKPQPKRQPVEAVTPPVSAPPVEPKK
jgi:peptidyl-prolyl cis-trans isomerase C